MEVLELEVKTEKIIAFAWEPQGHRFCIIHGEGARPDVSFYTMRDGGGSKLKHLATFKGKSANAIFWSPAGRHLVLAGLKGLNGQLEFFSADEMETLATAEHFMCTDVDWDPTGRYVATSVTAVHAMENGFNVWSFNGQLLYRCACAAVRAAGASAHARPAAQTAARPLLSVSLAPAPAVHAVRGPAKGGAACWLCVLVWWRAC